jgi:hypothetical protein
MWNSTSVIAKRILLRIRFPAALVRLPACMTCGGLRLKTNLPWLVFTRPTHSANVTSRMLRRALAWLEGDLRFYTGNVIIARTNRLCRVRYIAQFERHGRRGACVAYVLIRILIPDEHSFIRRLLRSGFQINSGEFIGLHANCIAAIRAYFVEAERTSAMLAQSTAEPLPLTERLSLLSREIIENESHMKYVVAKSLLHEAARLGYGFSNLTIFPFRGEICPIGESNEKEGTDTKTVVLRPVSYVWCRCGKALCHAVRWPTPRITLIPEAFSG